jgi:hypothetical protein
MFVDPDAVAIESSSKAHRINIGGGPEFAPATAMCAEACELVNAVLKNEESEPHSLSSTQDVSSY